MIRLTCIIAFVAFTSTAQGQFSGPYAPQNWTFTPNGGDGAVFTFGAPFAIEVLGNDNGERGVNTDYTATVAAEGVWSFHWETHPLDKGDFDSARYLLNGAQFFLGDNSPPNSGSVAQVPVQAGDVIGFRVHSTDGIIGPLTLIISDFTAPLPVMGPACEVDKLLASDGSQADFFGTSVSVSGDIAIIGAERDDDNGSDAGSAYIFRNNGADNWAQLDKLLASDGASADFFGTSVGISGDTAIVGAYLDDDNGTGSGSAYIFHDSGSGKWVEIDKLTASDGSSGDRFGISVSISGDTAVVGAYFADQNGSSAGSAYVFRDDGSGNWSEIARLNPIDNAPGDVFGHSVAISGNTAVVGASGDNDNGASSGSAYVFRDNGRGKWVQIDKITASDGALQDHFGSPVAIYGSDIAVGAREDDDNGLNSGSAYVFTETGAGEWIEIAKLLASDGAAGDGFGRAIAIGAGVVVVGAEFDDNPSSSSGSAYIFHPGGLNTWLESQKITASDATQGDEFGGAVGLAGNIAVIGAIGDDNGGASGSAYIFDVHCDVPGDVNGDGVVDVNDLLALIIAWGPCPPVPGRCLEDLNNDGFVNVDDLLIMIQHWG